MAVPAATKICVLRVDGPGLVDLSAELLEREREELVVETATGAAEGLEVLAERPVDCVVSDYEMPGRDGIDFLEAVREEHPDLPLTLLTGKGNEAVASRTVSAGVTDYLSKGGGTDQYTLLANRITDAVGRTRAERACTRQREAIEAAHEGIALLDTAGRFTYVDGTYADLYGYEPEELVGEGWELLYPDDEAAGSTSPDSHARRDGEGLRPPGGRLEADEAGVRVTVGDLPGGFYIADDGPGIPPGDHEQVFRNGYSNSSALSMSFIGTAAYPPRRQANRPVK